MVRVIAGSAKGRRLATSHTLALRPTPDRVREALFNILGVQTDGAAILDLFAGSGGRYGARVAGRLAMLVEVPRRPVV